VPSDEPREAFVFEAGGTVHVCPVQARLRCWMALGQFREGLPETLLHAFVPPASLERADADHASWGRSASPMPPRILPATWVGADPPVRAEEAGQTALEALADGDELTATAAYRSVVDRWGRVRALEHAN